MLGEDRGTSRPATADPAAAAASEGGQAPAPSSRPQSAMSFRPRTASTTGGRSAPASRPRSAASSVGSGNGGRISAQGMRSLSRSMLLEQKQKQQGVDRVTVSRGVQHKPKSARYVPAFPLQPLSSCLEICCHPRDALPMTCTGFVLLWLRPPPGPSIDDERGEALDALFFSPGRNQFDICLCSSAGATCSCSERVDAKSEHIHRNDLKRRRSKLHNNESCYELFAHNSKSQTLTALKQTQHHPRLDMKLLN